MLVQAEKHFCELVHEAPRRPAPDALAEAGWSRQIRRMDLLVMMHVMTATTFQAPPGGQFQQTNELQFSVPL